MLTGQDLKTHVGYFIADANLPFAIIERSSFINLLGAYNGNAPQMMVKADAIQNHLFRMYAQHREIHQDQSFQGRMDRFYFRCLDVKFLMALTAH